MSLTDQLRKAIQDSRLSLYRIAKDSELSYAIVHRFASGERDIKLSTADRLAEFFDMRLTRPKK